MKTIKELEIELQYATQKRGKAGDELNEAREKLDAAVSEVNAVKVEIWQHTNSLKIGDAVSFKYGKQTKTGVLTGFNTRWSDISPIITLHKKDGSLGVRTHDYFSSPLEKI